MREEHRIEFEDEEGRLLYARISPVTGDKVHRAACSCGYMFEATDADGLGLITADHVREANER